jgi:hypothetical protein
MSPEDSPWLTIQWKIQETGWILLLKKHEENFKFSTTSREICGEVHMICQQQNPVGVLEITSDSSSGRI